MSLRESAVELLEKLDKLETEVKALREWRETVSGFPELPPIMTAADVARTLQCSQTAAYDVLKSGELKAIRHGGMVRCSRAAFLEWVGRGGDREKETQKWKRTN